MQAQGTPLDGAKAIGITSTHKPVTARRPASDPGRGTSLLMAVRRGTRTGPLAFSGRKALGFMQPSDRD